MRVPGQHQPVIVTRQEIDRILRFVFGEKRAATLVEPMGGGSINSVYRVDLGHSESYVLRVAPSEAMAAHGPGWLTPYGLRRELAVIDVASSLSEFLPVTLAHDFDRSLLDRDWVIQEMMTGVSLATIDDTLDLPARSAVWAELGAFTRTLHDISSDRFGPPAWGPTFASWADQVRWDAASLIDDAVKFGLPAAAFDRLANVAERLAPLLDEVTTSGLIHSDLSRTHVFVEPGIDGRVRLAGVIDLEFGRFADPLSEHLITGFEWNNAPVDARPAFMRGYGLGEITPHEETRVGLYVALSLAWLVPLLAFQGQSYDDVMTELTQSLETLDRLTTRTISDAG